MGSLRIDYYTNTRIQHPSPATSVQTYFRCPLPHVNATPDPKLSLRKAERILKYTVLHAHLAIDKPISSLAQKSPRSSSHVAVVLHHRIQHKSAMLPGCANDHMKKANRLRPLIRVASTDHDARPPGKPQSHRLSWRARVYARTYPTQRAALSNDTGSNTR